MNRFPEHMMIMKRISLLFLLVFLVFGCALGKKEWPAATEREESFALEVLDGYRAGDCLHLELSLSGSVDNLSHLAVQLEPIGIAEGMGCPGCPFMPRESRRIPPGPNGYGVTGSNNVSICGLANDLSYRFRVVGVNFIGSLPTAYSDVFEVDP